MGRAGSGVEVRGASIRLLFVWQGERIRERLTLNGKALAPTPANVKYVQRIAGEIKRHIAHGTFNYFDYFPDSERVGGEAKRNVALGELAALWLQAQGRLTASTRDQYATAVRFWLRLLGKSKPIESISHALLAAKIGGYPWPSPKTHNNYLIALRGIFALHYRGPQTLSSPLIGIENMTVIKKLPDPLTCEERDQILADIALHYPEQVLAYFQFMFYTGMRPEEAIALRWSDVDWQRLTVRVQRVRTFKGSERAGSKTHSEREVDLVPQAIDALKKMKAHTYLLKVVRDSDEDTSADIFQNPVTKRHWHDERSQRDYYWRPSLKRLGIRWRRPYNTRHTFATAALTAGVPPAYIAAQLGHSVKMLLERYTRWIPANDGGNARAILERAMSQKTSAMLPGFSENCSQFVPKTGV